MRHLPTLVYGVLGAPAVVASRTAADDLRWAVIGLYSASDDEPATCIFRPARLDDLAVCGCAAIESDGSSRAFPDIGPLTAMMWKSMPDLAPSFQQFASGLKHQAERKANT